MQAKTPATVVPDGAAYRRRPANHSDGISNDQRIVDQRVVRRVLVSGGSYQRPDAGIFPELDIDDLLLRTGVLVRERPARPRGGNGGERHAARAGMQPRRVRPGG